MLDAPKPSAGTGLDGATEARHRRLSPPSLLLGGLIAQAGVHVTLPIVRVLEWPWALLGVAPLLTGIALMVVADLQFKRVGTPVRPGRPATALVTGGVFRISRNPMYAGMLLVLYGAAMVLGTLSPLLVPPLIGRVLSVRFIRWEERVLLESFGSDYRDYTRRVGRWVWKPIRSGGRDA
jgi:protein-S-isoprenylcysteine O-methyltransferase Ste14